LIKMGRHGGHQRAHRRSNNRNILVGGGLVLVLVLAIVGFTVIHGSSSSSSSASNAVSTSCEHGSGNITVAAAPSIAPTLTTLAGAFRPQGKCTVQVVAQEPAAVAGALKNGAATVPDVWVPDSSLWGRLASTHAPAQALLPPSGPSVASSPVVIAMPQPMATAITDSGEQLTWYDAFNLIHTTRTWSELGHSDWGPIRYGLADGQQSIDQVQALLAITAGILKKTDANALPDADIQAAAPHAMMIELGRQASRRAPTTAALLAGLRAAGGGTAGLKYLSFLPASEQAVAAYNQSSPPIRLTAVYSAGGSPSDDFPYLALRRSQAGLAASTISDFQAYLHTPKAEAILATAGFRTGAAGPFTTANGLAPKPTATTLAATTGEVLDLTLRSWTGLTFTPAASTLIATTASMGDKGVADVRRMVPAMIDLFDEQGSGGLTVAGPTVSDDREVVAYGPLADPVGGVSRADAISHAAETVTATPKVALYDAILASYQAAQARYQPGTIAGVNVFTDGHDGGSKITFDALVAQLKSLYNPARPVRVFVFAFGSNRDVTGLDLLSSVTRGQSFSSLITTEYDLPIAMLNVCESFIPADPGAPTPLGAGGVTAVPS
jgi:Ca-activated chloride channel family protein